MIGCIMNVIKESEIDTLVMTWVNAPLLITFASHSNASMLSQWPC